MVRPYFALLCVCLVLMLAPLAQAQQAPRVGYVYPAGGQRGSTFETVLGGQRLDRVMDGYVSGGGVHVKIVEFSKPLTPAQFQRLRQELRELQDKKIAAGRDVTTRPATAPRPATTPATRPAATTRAVTTAASQPVRPPVWTPEDEKRLAEVRKRLLNPPRRDLSPAIAETVRVQVTIDKNAEPGQRELRLLTPAGLTNPIVFMVGQLPETHVKELHPKAGGGATLPARFQEALPVTLPVTLNGRILPGGVELFRFSAKKSQHVVAAVRARTLMPYISDAVPGWFQAAVTLYDARGREVAFADHDRHQPDPVVHCVIPADGEYVLEIRDSIYRGREDFVYRIALGELPWITSIFPRGGKAGAITSVQLRGWNLPVSVVNFDAREKPPGVYAIAAGRGGSNAVPFAVDDLPEVPRLKVLGESSPVQTLTLPTIVNGCIARAGETHTFAIAGKAGEEIVAEVLARRLDSPLDSVLTLLDATGRQVAYNDDHEDKGAGLNTHHADSYLRVKLPADGTYTLQLADVQGKGGPGHSYRLRVSAPRPEFALRVVPASIAVRGGASVPVTVYALRRDGFAGAIDLELRGHGFTLSGGKLPAGQEQVKVTIKAPATHLDEPVRLELEGRAKIGAQTMTHAAVPAVDMMQAFFYRHLVPAQEFMAAVTPAPIARANIKVLSATPVKFTPGETTRIELTVPVTTVLGKVEIDLPDPPTGISLKSVTLGRERSQVVLACDAATARPGAKGNLILSLFVDRRPAASEKNPQPARRRLPMGTVPAISYEIGGEANIERR